MLGIAVAQILNFLQNRRHGALYPARVAQEQKKDEKQIEDKDRRDSAQHGAHIGPFQGKVVFH